MLYQLIYYSVASAEFGVDESLKMLLDARISNERRGITGMLLYHKGLFLQVLEGGREELASLSEKIFEDPRHHDVEQIAFEPISKRSFSNWSMGFANLGDAAHVHIRGHQEVHEAMLQWESKVLGLDAAKQLLLKVNNNS
jgi:Sensors of blue-light using FAD